MRPLETRARGRASRALLDARAPAPQNTTTLLPDAVGSSASCAHFSTSSKRYCVISPLTASAMSPVCHLTPQLYAL
jgi:hypothetical protein